MIDRLVERADDIVVVDFGTLKPLAQRLSRHRDGIAMQLAAKPFHQRAEAPGIIEILHQIGLARWPDVGDHRRHPALGVEIVQGELDTGAPRHGNQMDDGIGRTACRHGNGHGVFHRLRRNDFAGRQVFPDHLDSAASTGRTHALVIGVRRRNGAGAGQAQAHGFGNRGHGAGGAHGHAVAVGSRNPTFHARPLFPSDGAGAAFVPILEGIGARAQRLALVVAAQHGAGGQINERIAGRDGAHDETGRGLVAAAEQDRAVDRVGAQQFFRLHGEEIAIQHGRGLLERFGERDRRHLQRETARLQNAALHVLRPLAQVCVAGIDIAPGVDDADDRAFAPIALVIAHLTHA